MRKYSPLRIKKIDFKRIFSNRKSTLTALAALLLAAFLIYQIPFINEKLSWRVNNLRTQITYYFNPPDEAIFVPEQQSNFVATVSVIAASRTPTTTTPHQATPSPTLPAVQAEVILEGVNYVDQHARWNYCGPANLAMALNFWGWKGNRDDVAKIVKPGVGRVDGKEDKNVMSYEMEDFVESQLGMQAVVRVGGEPYILKRLIEAGFPVIVEKGYYESDYTGKLAWLGHYQFVTGYSDIEGHFVVQDTYLETGDNGTGANLKWEYGDFVDNWRSFNFLFIVVYPEDRRAELIESLGPWSDEGWANRHALELANAEGNNLSGIAQYFAYFNQGSSHVRLFEYVDAAFAYDYAFQLYAQLPSDDTSRPYRMLWYQTGPYLAYYFSGRYQDTINLANTTLYETIDEPTLEESLYWRGLAYDAIGEIDNALADYRETVRLNPNFSPGLAALERLGGN